MGKPECVYRTMVPERYQILIYQVPFDDGFEVMKDALDIDVDFKAFHKFCLENDIPFNVISAGLKPILRRVLDEFLGEEEVLLHFLIILSFFPSFRQVNVQPPRYSVLPHRDCRQRRPNQYAGNAMAPRLAPRQ